MHVILSMSKGGARSFAAGWSHVFHAIALAMAGSAQSFFLAMARSDRVGRSCWMCFLVCVHVVCVCVCDRPASPPRRCKITLSLVAQPRRRDGEGSQRMWRSAPSPDPPDAALAARLRGAKAWRPRR